MADTTSQLCVTCGRGVTLPHAEWCERVAAANARPTAPRFVDAQCADQPCDRKPRSGVLCDMHRQRRYRLTRQLVDA